MESLLTQDYLDAYLKLSAVIREQARAAYQRFKENPSHPGLQFKLISRADNIWSVRISQGYRALGVRDGNQIRWFWIGTHAEYDRLLTRL